MMFVADLLIAALVAMVIIQMARLRGGASWWGFAVVPE